MVAQGVKDGIKVSSFAIDSRFNGGSINASAGEAIVYCFQKAIDDLTPVVAWSEGGGQAMQSQYSFALYGENCFGCEYF